MGFISALFALVGFVSGVISIFLFFKSRTGTQAHNLSMLGLLVAGILLGAILLTYFSANTSTSGRDKSVNLPTAAPTAIPTPTATASPTPQPAPSPTPTPAFTLNVPSRFAGTYYQTDGSSYQVRLEITKQNADGSFDGKWYVIVNGSEEDLIVTGVIAPFSRSGQLSQIDQTQLQPIQQINQQDGGNDLLLWFESTRRDRGQDILLGYVYYGAIEKGGYVQGASYLAGSSESAATFQLNSRS